MNLKHSISVVIVEDDPIFRENIAEIVLQAPETKLLEVFSDAAYAIEKLPEIRPDIVLIDIDLNGDSGIRVINKVKQLDSKIEFIVLTVFSDSKNLFDALKAGASGYILKEATGQTIIKSISEVMHGGAPMTPKMAKILTRYFYQQEPHKNPKLEQLTHREQQILDLLSEGYVAKKIAQKIDVSYETVRCHQKSIYKKLQVHSLYEAVTLNRPPW